MNRKILISALAALLMSASLTACQSEDAGSPSSGTDTGTGTVATGTVAQEQEKAPLPRYDYMTADVADDVDIDRADYTGLTLTVPDTLKVEEEDVQNYIENIRFQYRVPVNGTTMVKDKPLAWGDDAYIYYKGFLNGEEFEGGSNWEDASPYKLGLGSGAFIPGFEEALVGILPNATSKSSPAEIQVTFPADYGEASLAGKAVVFRVAVEYAVQYTLPEYNRELVETTLKYEPQKEFYASDKALLDEFEEYVFDHLVKQNQSSVESAKNAALWEHLTEAATCRNLPSMEVDYYFDAYSAELEYYYQYYLSYGGEQFRKEYPTMDAFAPLYFGLGADADWKAEVRGYSEELVRRDMIVHAIAEREEMETVSDEEFEAQVQYWISYYSSGYGAMTRDDIIENVGETFLLATALQEKMDTWLMEQVNFTFEDGTPLVTTTENNG